MLLPVLLMSAPLCHATDGDSIRCGKERIRLLGIDAPETAGHCRRGRICAPGNADASTQSLKHAIAGRDIKVQRLTKDRYGRTLAVVYAGSRNLSCSQLRSGNAFYKPKWDNGGRIAAACPDATQR